MVLNKESEYYSCSMINDFHLNFKGRLDTKNEVVALCCGNADGLPKVALGKTGQETIENFIKMRETSILEGYPHRKLFEKKFTESCSKCPNYILDRWQNAGLIHHVNFSMYPAPCQCKCIYCPVRKNGSVRQVKAEKFDEKAVEESYYIMFDAVDYAQKIKLIAPNASWQIASGEIAIHPYKDRILNLVRNKSATFFTNCFIYDEDINTILKTNSNSKIHLSIDAGTPKTWRKVKGFDNFNDIIDNLENYCKNSQPNQIILKYIILPSINDKYEDFSSVIELMKTFNIETLKLARDVTKRYISSSDEQRKKLIKAASYFVAMLHKNNLQAEMPTYTHYEQKAIIKYANELHKFKIMDF